VFEDWGPTTRRGEKAVPDGKRVPAGKEAAPTAQHSGAKTKFTLDWGGSHQ